MRVHTRHYKPLGHYKAIRGAGFFNDARGKLMKIAPSKKQLAGAAAALATAAFMAKVAHSTGSSNSLDGKFSKPDLGLDLARRDFDHSQQQYGVKPRYKSEVAKNLRVAEKRSRAARIEQRNNEYLQHNRDTNLTWV